MTSHDKFDEWALHAYVDNEISDEQRAEIEAMLRSDPDAARQVDAWRQQKDALRRAYDAILDEPVPHSLMATLRQGGQPVWRPYMAMAAALALVFLGGVGGWFMALDTNTAVAQSIASEALTAHEVYSVEVRHPVEVGAEDRDHLQAWLSKRIGVAFTLPDLSKNGYTLLGGRLLASADRPAAQLMYEDSNRKRITIFLTSQTESHESALQVEERGPLIACYWLDGKLAFAVAGDMAREPMMKLANDIYEQFES